MPGTCEFFDDSYDYSYFDYDYEIDYDFVDEPYSDDLKIFGNVLDEEEAIEEETKNLEVEILNFLEELEKKEDFDYY